MVREETDKRVHEILRKYELKAEKQVVSPLTPLEDILQSFQAFYGKGYITYKITHSKTDMMSVVEVTVHGNMWMDIAVASEINSTLTEIVTMIIEKVGENAKSHFVKYIHNKNQTIVYLFADSELYEIYDKLRGMVSSLNIKIATNIVKREEDIYRSFMAK